jgi:hypothetical protein
MSCHVTVDDALIRQAREVAGLMSDRDLVELSLRALIQARHKVLEAKQPDANPDTPPENPLLALLDSSFIGCAHSDRVDLSETWKSELTAVLGAKHGHR